MRGAEARGETAAGFRLSDACEILERTPAILRAWLSGLDEAWLSANEGPDTFDPREVLGHLLHGEEADWIPRARIILEHGPGRPFDPYDRFAQRRLFAKYSVEEMLDQFAARRAENLATLRAWQLDEQKLDLPGTHPSLGAVTLRELLATWVVHDLGHLAQVARVMAKRYTGQVGAWREYLPVLRDRTGPRS